ncbi:helix-turn-helix transcriptional regulator [Sphingobacterium sp. MYb382]|uniref:helix-turn-helix transcriptional regulator n=1 Tax=Sphingobacterium sp. MYb382 TaxID=2745278 RepID=UPI0030AD6F4B
MPFISAQYNFKHKLVEGAHTLAYNAQEAHYLNIILSDDSDSINYRIDDHQFLLEKGFNTIHYINAGATIDFISPCPSNRCVIIIFSPEHLHFFHEKYHQETDRFLSGYFTRSDQHLRLLFEQICGQTESEDFFKLKRELILLEIILRQAETLVVESENHEVIALKSHYDKIVLAKQIIEDDLSQSHSIPELAKQVGTNVQYLKKYFKQYFGKTVMNYITDKKMEYAKELIMTGQHRISDVAHMTGYKHSTHFTTAFKKHYGFIPNSLKYTFLLQQGATVLSELETIIQQIL